MRRRLSLAVAYISAPRVIVLGEPSTGEGWGSGVELRLWLKHPSRPGAGVDPAASRTMLDAVRSAQAGRATLLTTHAMEDADALSTHIGILVAGTL